VVEQFVTVERCGVEVGDVIQIETHSHPTFCIKGWGIWLQLPVRVLPNWVWSALVRTFWYQRMPWVPNWLVDFSVFVNRYLYGRVCFGWPIRISRYNPYDSTYTVSSIDDNTILTVTPYGDPRIMR
jgi:hypothetical protein